MLQAHKYLPIWLLLFVIPSLLSSCASSVRTSSGGDITIEQRHHLAQQHPIQIQEPLIERVSIIPKSLLQTWAQADTSLNPKAKKYQAYLPSPQEKLLLRNALSYLPQQWQDMLKQKLTRIFFVENLIGAGITDWVIDTKTGERFYTIILNPRVFHVSAQAWLEYRANTMFSQGEYKVTYNGLDDISAMTYAIFHEAAHIIDFEKRFTPVVDPLIAQYMTIDKTPTAFTTLVWKAYSQPNQTFDYTYRKQLNAYQLNTKKGYIDNAKLPELFQHLARLPYVSFYASLSWAEDFADLSAFYYLEKQALSAIHLQLKKGKETIVDIRPLGSSLNQQRLLKLDLAKEKGAQ